MMATVRLFARIRDLAGTDKLTVSLPEGATVGQLRPELARQYPALAGLLERSLLAVNEEYVDETTPLTPECEIALLPPVSGGCTAHDPTDP